MKRVMIIAVIAMVAMASAFGQEKIGEYEMQYLEKSFDVSVSEDKGEYTYYIDAYSSDDLYKSVGLSVKPNKLDEFRAAFVKARDKYVEWSHVATENNVKDMSKEIEVKSPKVTGLFYTSEWNFDFSVGITFQFMVLEDGEQLLVVWSDKMTASDNQYIDHKGTTMAFNSVGEIDAFIELLNPAVAKEKLNAKDNLFKN